MARAAWLTGFLAIASTGVHAQTSEPSSPQTSPTWNWRFDGNVVAGFNYQYRKFWDFWALESQNWFMAAGDRASGPHRVSVSGMVSLERLTMHRLGSHQVFQTGETLDGAPLIDYQHPHDLIMNLGGRYTRQFGRASAYVGLYIVGEPALGPIAFMHRPSADGNPQVPLGHHFFDATHITPGVVKGGLTLGPATLEAAWFRGREPDENRWDLDVAKPDLWSVRGNWIAGPWHVQVSGAHVTQPEPIEPFDVDKLSASVTYSRGTSRGHLAWTLAWGQNREFYGIQDAYLAEANWRPSGRTTLYGRAELVTKNILTAGGRHPIGFTHPHVNSRIGALTLGYLRETGSVRVWRVGIGTDVTGYAVPKNLKDNYGQPWSFHVFVRVRPGVGAERHVH